VGRVVFGVLGFSYSVGSKIFGGIEGRVVFGFLRFSWFYELL